MRTPMPQVLGAPLLSGCTTLYRQKLLVSLFPSQSIRFRTHQLYIAFIQLIGIRFLSHLLCLPQLEGRHPSRVSSAPFLSLSLLSLSLNSRNSWPQLQHIRLLHLPRFPHRRRPLDFAYLPVLQLRRLYHCIPLGIFHQDPPRHQPRKCHGLYLPTWSFPLSMSLHYPRRPSLSTPLLLTIPTSHILSYQPSQEPQRIVLVSVNNRRMSYSQSKFHLLRKRMTSEQRAGFDLPNLIRRRVGKQRRTSL